MADTKVSLKDRASKVVESPRAKKAIAIAIIAVASVMFPELAQFFDKIGQEFFAP